MDAIGGLGSESMASHEGVDRPAVGELKAARERLEEDEAGVRQRIDQLLDNLTAENREFVDERLRKLKTRRDALSARREELERLELGQVAVTATAEEAGGFLVTLPGVLREGLPQEKLVALRRCLERVWVDQEKGALKLAVRRVPAAATPAVEEVRVTFSSYRPDSCGDGRHADTDVARRDEPNRAGCLIVESE